MAQLQIDGEKLRERLFAAGVKPSVASTEIGFAASYWGKAMKAGYCSIVAAHALQARYGISPEDYTAPDDEPEAAQAPEKTGAAPTPAGGETVTISVDALRETIREAILDAAVQIAASEELQHALNRTIYGAVYGAGINLERMRGGV